MLLNVYWNQKCVWLRNEKPTKIGGVAEKLVPDITVFRNYNFGE